MTRIVRTAIVGGALIATLGLAACTGPNSPATTDPKPPTTEAANPKVTAPSEAEQFASWYADIEADLDTFIGHTSQAGETPDNVDLYYTLLDDIGRMRIAGPCPDHNVDRHWQMALDSYETGFSFAIDGLERSDPERIVEATTHILEGNQHIQDATDAIGAETV